LIIKFNIILIPMRSLTTALGCLVIAAYATIGQATENHDMGSNLIAKCHFGHNGYVIFRQRPDDRDHIRANQYDRKKIGGTKKGKKKLMMMQQVAAAGAGPVAAAVPVADELEEVVDAEYADDGALNEGRKGGYDSDHFSEEEDLEAEGEFSAEEDEETDEKLRKAEAEAS
jgi:hypothetical protein